jgi:hypothetical protein
VLVGSNKGPPFQECVYVSSYTNTLTDDDGAVFEKGFGGHFARMIHTNNACLFFP